MTKLTHAQRCELIVLLRDALLERGYRLNASRQSAYNWATHRSAPSSDRLFAALMASYLLVPYIDALLGRRLRSIGIDLPLDDLFASLTSEIASPIENDAHDEV